MLPHALVFTCLRCSRRLTWSFEFDEVNTPEEYYPVRGVRSSNPFALSDLASQNIFNLVYEVRFYITLTQFLR